MKVWVRVVVSLAISLGASELPAADGVMTQATNQIRIDAGGASLDDAGTTVYASANADVEGLNPDFSPALFRWDAATGVGSLIAPFPDGVSTSRDAVSDDGSWLAFISRANPTGQNPDHGAELFVRRLYGSVLRQLTNSSAGKSDDVREYALSGSGNRLVFSSRTDPLGTNPGHVTQLFDIDADGTNLRQLTNSTADSGFEMSISDDGTRIVFSHGGDLTGGNADLSPEVFAIEHDGTNLRQLTNSAGGGDTASPRISGNGATVTFDSDYDLGGLNPARQLQVWVMDWAGTGLRQITGLQFNGALQPSISDDGTLIAYSSNDASQGDGLSYEIWRINADGTGKTVLTDTPVNTQCLAPVLSGDGSRIAFSRLDPIGTYGHFSTVVMDSAGGALQPLIDERQDTHGTPDMTTDGTRLVFSWDGDPFGSNPTHKRQIFRIQSDGTQLAQITTLNDGDAHYPRVTDSGQTIVFTSDANPTGSNPSHYYEPFSVKYDGSQLRQLTPAGTNLAGFKTPPAIAGGGSWIIFQSKGNPTGGNADRSLELFRVSPFGTSLGQITSDNDTVHKAPRISATGLWVTYRNSSGIWRVQNGGSGRQQITTYPGWSPDVSGDGTRYVWVANANPLGLNPDGSAEIFSWDVSPSTYRQLTSLPAGSMIGSIRLSRDGAYVSFATDAPLFEPEFQLGVPYRLEVASGSIERIAGLGSSSAVYDNFYAGDEFMPIGTDGSKIAFDTYYDPVLANKDVSTELMVVDLSRTPAIRVSKSSPTVVSWEADPHVVRYDVIRGDVADMTSDASTVDLGTVACIANDAPRLDTSDAPDAIDPDPGRTFFYLLRGSAGSLAGAGSYGQGSGGQERVPNSGDCPP